MKYGELRAQGKSQQALHVYNWSFAMAVSGDAITISFNAGDYVGSFIFGRGQFEGAMETEDFTMRSMELIEEHMPDMDPVVVVWLEDRVEMGFIDDQLIIESEQD